MELSRRDFTRLSLAGAAALAAPAILATPALAARRRTFDYGPNKLDWYPARGGARNAPVLVYVHGGAWALGNKGQVHGKPDHFTKRGYHFASVGYSLFPRANAEEQALQVGTAVNWVQANAAKLKADPNRIALMGHSAGCHLSSLATLAGAAMPVKAIVCNDTRAYDLPYLAQINGGRLPLLYKAPFTRRKMWRAWSPISYAALKPQPPTLVAWSNGVGRDKVSIRFADALEAEGTEVYRYNGKRQYNHISIDRAMGRKGDRLTKAVDQFLDDVLSRSA